MMWLRRLGAWVVAFLLVLASPAFPVGPFSVFEVGDPSLSGVGGVDASPSLVIVGGADPDTSTTQIHLFTRPDGGWADTQSAQGVLGHQSGVTFVGDPRLGGDTVATAAVDGTDSLVTVELYQRPETGWSSTSAPDVTLTPPDGAAFGSLGVVSADFLAVMGQYADGDPGLFVYERPEGGWTSDAPFVFASLPDSLALGESAATDGDTIAVHATDTETDSGAVLLYERPASGSWVDLGAHTAKLTPTADLVFTGQVAVDGDSVAALGVDQSVAADVVLVFDEPESGWTDTDTPTATLGAPSGTESAGGLAMSGGILVSTAVDTGSGVGSAVVFGEPETGWSGADPDEVIVAPPPGGSFAGGVVIAEGMVVAADVGLDGAGVLVPGASEITPPIALPVGTLSVTPAPIDFPAVTLELDDEVATAPATQWMVEDTTGAAAGWNLTLSATDLVDGDGDSISVDGFSVQLDADGIALLTGSVQPTSHVTDPTPLSPEGVTVLSAGPGDPEMLAAITPTFRLLVPATTSSGTFSTAVTATISSGP